MEALMHVSQQHALDCPSSVERANQMQCTPLAKDGHLGAGHVGEAEHNSSDPRIILTAKLRLRASPANAGRATCRNAL